MVIFVLRGTRHEEAGNRYCRHRGFYGAISGCSGVVAVVAGKILVVRQVLLAVLLSVFVGQILFGVLLSVFVGQILLAVLFAVVVRQISSA
jgi:hypothetical protein